MSTEGRTLPPFPVDDFTLTQLEHALDATIDFDDNGRRIVVGADFTFAQFLTFMSGYDPERSTDTGREIDGIPVFEAWDQQYSEHCVIRALIARIRELEAS